MKFMTIRVARRAASLGGLISALFLCSGVQPSFISAPTLWYGDKVRACSRQRRLYIFVFPRHASTCISTAKEQSLDSGSVQIIRNYVLEPGFGPDGGSERSAGLGYLFDAVVKHGTQLIPWRMLARHDTQHSYFYAKIWVRVRGYI